MLSNYQVIGAVCLVLYYLLIDLLIGSYLAQLRPWGYSHFSLSIQKDSRYLSSSSICSAVSPVSGVTTWSSWMLMWIPVQFFSLKCSCSTPG